MSQPYLLAFGLSAILAIIHFLGEGIKIPKGPQQYRIVSFAAGISIGYLFLNLLPHTYEAAQRLDKQAFIALLLGFISVHLTEKFFYQHAVDDDLQKKLKVIHVTTFFVYYLLVGCVLVELATEKTVEAILFSFPIALHAGLSAASLSHIHGEFKHKLPEKILLSLACPLGVLLVFVVPVALSVHNFFISGIAGVLLYVFVKEFLPERTDGQPLFFITGLIAYYIVMNIFQAIFH